MRQVGRYDIDDPSKIQGRDEVNPSDRSVAAIRLRHALNALDGLEGRVLLLGCGAGRYVRALQRTRGDLSIVGGDLSSVALREAKAVDPAGMYLAMDASSLPLQDNSVDIVLFFDLLEHVPEYRTMLQDIYRVLKNPGLLHFYVPLEDQPGSIYHRLRKSRRIPLRDWKRDHVGHINFFQADEVESVCAQAGFEIEESHFGFHPFGQIHDLVDYWQRERNAGGAGLLPIKAVRLISRVLFMFTWRLSYIEDRFYQGPRLASGLHLTALKQ